MAQTDNERLQILRDKMAKLKAQKQAIINREKEKERKERTRRLIQKGALAEKYLKCEGVSPEDFEKLLQELVKEKNAETPAAVGKAINLCSPDNPPKNAPKSPQSLTGQQTRQTKIKPKKRPQARRQRKPKTNIDIKKVG